MRERSPRPPRSARLLLLRLDRAAGELNPVLMVVVIGLVILNLITAAAVVPHLRLTRADAAGPTCSAAAPNLTTP